jgi:uncharacterized protein YjbI with pentapeptide repeats
MFSSIPGASVAQGFRNAGLWLCLPLVLTFCTALIPPPRTPLNLSDAHLAHADFERADLAGANLRRVDLFQALLEGTQLRNADLRGANLENANLTSADLTDANLQGANLRGAVLSYSNLWGANLQGAQLEGAHLEMTRMGGATLTGASYDQNTYWPERVNPVACGAVQSETAWIGSRRPRRLSLRLRRAEREVPLLTRTPAAVPAAASL